MRRNPTVEKREWSAVAVPLPMMLSAPMAARMHCPAWLLLEWLRCSLLWCLSRRLRLCQEACVVEFQPLVLGWLAAALFGSIWPTQLRTRACVPTLQQARFLLGGSMFQLQFGLGLSQGRDGAAAALPSRYSLSSSSCCSTFSRDPEVAAVSGTWLFARWNWSETGGLMDGGAAGNNWGRGRVAVLVAAVPHPRHCPAPCCR